MSALSLSGWDPDIKEDDLTLTSYKGKLGVLIKSCSNLAIKDVTGSSDPYVKFGKVASRAEKAPKGIKTTTKSKQLNPVWGESFVLELREDSDLIKFEVWDKDPVFDDFLGECVLSIRSLVVEIARAHLSKHVIMLKHNLSFNFKDIRDQLATTSRQYFLMPRPNKKDTVSGSIKFDVSLQLDQLDALVGRADAVYPEIEAFEKAHADQTKRDKAEARSIAKKKKQAAEETAAEVIEAINAQLATGSLADLDPAELVSCCPLDHQPTVEERVATELTKVLLTTKVGQGEFDNPKSVFLDLFVRWVCQRTEFPSLLVEPIYTWALFPEVSDSSVDLLLTSIAKFKLSSSPPVKTFLAANPYSRSSKKLTIVLKSKYSQDAPKKWSSEDYALLARHLISLSLACQEISGVHPELQLLVALVLRRVFAAEDNVLCLRKDPSKFSYDTVETARIKSKHQKMWQAVASLVSAFLERPSDPTFTAIMRSESAMLLGDGLNENRRILSLPEEFFLLLKTTFRKEWKVSTVNSVSLLVSDTDSSFSYAFLVSSQKRKIEEGKV